MDAEFAKRKQELLDECKIDPKVTQRVMPRLEEFAQPFVDVFVRTEQVNHVHTMLRGLLSDIEHKNTESIALRFGQDRMPLQMFMGVSGWDDEPLRNELVRQVAQDLGQPDGVIVFDPSAFPKSGRASVGVARQWCGRLGKVANCQVGIYMGYVSSIEHALVDMRLYLPKEWTDDKARCRAAGVPNNIRYRSRHKLALEMLDKHGQTLPHQWIAGDDEMGRPYWFRRRLNNRNEQYLLAVPSNTLIRDRDADPPEYSGRGRKPKRPWIRVDEWKQARREDEWTEIDVRDGAKGPLIVEILKRRVVARTDRRQEGHAEVLVVIRYKDRDNEQLVKTDYYLSNASGDTPESEFARVAKAEHRIEECIRRGKSEAGLGDYQIRNWNGWHHHQTLSLIANWFLVSETLRGKKMDPGHHGRANPASHCYDPSSCLPVRHAGTPNLRTRATTRTQRTRSLLSLETT